MFRPTTRARLTRPAMALLGLVVASSTAAGELKAQAPRAGAPARRAPRAGVSSAPPGAQGRRHAGNSSRVLFLPLATGRGALEPDSVVNCALQEATLRGYQVVTYATDANAFLMDRGYSSFLPASENPGALVPQLRIRPGPWDLYTAAPDGHGAGQSTGPSSATGPGPVAPVVWVEGRVGQDADVTGPASRAVPRALSPRERARALAQLRTLVAQDAHAIQQACAPVSRTVAH